MKNKKKLTISLIENSKLFSRQLKDCLLAQAGGLSETQLDKVIKIFEEEKAKLNEWKQQDALSFALAAKKQFVDISKKIIKTKWAKNRSTLLSSTK